MLTIIDLSQKSGSVNFTKLPVGCDLKKTGAEKVFLTRDFFSSIPLFYAVEEGNLILADTYLELLGSLHSKALTSEPDLEFIKLYLAFQAPLTSRTLEKKINLVRPGERLVFDAKGSCKKSLFNRNSQTNSQLSQIDFKKSIESTVKGINPDSTTFHISSGLDSSILAITAARVFPGSTIQLASCQTRGQGCTDELTNSIRLADDIGAEITVYDLTEIDVFTEGRDLIRKCLGYPLAHPSHLVEYLLDKKIAESGSKTIVNGKGPDDCLAGYAWHLEEFHQPLQHRSRLMVTSEAEITELTGSSIQFQPDGDFWKDTETALSLEQRLEYDVSSLTEAWNLIHHTIAGSLDVDIISPFMDPEIRSGLFALDDHLKIKNGLQKFFLRQTFNQEYPDYILNFSKHGLRLDLRPYFLEYSRDELYNRITGEMSEVGKYFNTNRIWQMIDATLSGEKNYGWQLWSIFCLIVALQDF